MDEILKILTLEENKFKSENWISKNYPNFHFFIDQKINKDISWKEKLFLYKNNIDNQPTCYCGKILRFEKGRYRTYCSNKCMSNSPDIKDKRIKTCVDKYGCDNPMKSIEIIGKLKDSTFEKYGVDNVSKLKSVKDKVKATNNSKFGVDYVSQLDSVKEKLKLLMNSKTIELNSINKIKLSDKIQSRISKFNLNLLKISDTSIYEIKCTSNHIFTIHKTTLNDRIRNNNTICTVCNPISSFSDSENNLFMFIRENYEGDILNNDRTIIGPEEIDIYLPKLKIAFEFNGVYWHSDIYKSNNYHLNKTKKCSEIGVKLIHIWEDDWLYKTDIVKSRILNIINKSKKIWARNCEVREITYKESSNFLLENHIQGDTMSKIRIGLYHNNDILATMTFGKLRRSLGQSNIEGCYELLRFCSLRGTSVIGGASKIFSFFIKKYKPIHVISYADRCWSDGNLYKRLGFSLVSITKPNYYYVVDGIRKNRFNFRKDRLVKMGHDPSKSERYIMCELGYSKIYDSGNFKFIYFQK